MEQVSLNAGVVALYVGRALCLSEGVIGHNACASLFEE
jgi:hypothetical protein